MVIVFPIVIREPGDVWLSPDGIEVMRRRLNDFLLRKDLGRCFVYTNQGLVREMAQTLGVDVVCEESARERFGWLCEGTMAAARYARGRYAGECERIAVVNFRYPMVTPDVVAEAFQRNQNGPKPVLVSLSQPRDHPAQCKSYIRFVDTGLIHLLDHSADPRAFCAWIDGRQWWATRPFSLNWGPGGQPECSRSAFRKKVDRIGCLFEPATSEMQEMEEILWVRTGEREARLLVKRAALDATAERDVGTGMGDAVVEGVSTMGNRLCRPVLIDTPDRGGLSARMKPREGNSSECTLQLIPFDRKGVWRAKAVKVRIGDLDREIHVGHAADGMAGFVYYLFLHAENEAFEICEPVFPKNGPWGLDRNTYMPMNLLTGKVIRGRQDLPEVYGLDGALCVLPGETIQSLDSGAFDRACEGFVLEPALALRVESAVDLIRYRVRIREVGYV